MTWVSSWASSWRPVGVEGWYSPALNTMWEPAVYARAPMSAAERLAAASVWVRTAAKSAPSRLAISCRTAGSSGCPGKRTVSATDAGTALQRGRTALLDCARTCYPGPCHVPRSRSGLRRAVPADRRDPGARPLAGATPRPAGEPPLGCRPSPAGCERRRREGPATARVADLGGWLVVRVAELALVLEPDWSFAPSRFYCAPAQPSPFRAYRNLLSAPVANGGFKDGLTLPAPEQRTRALW